MRQETEGRKDVCRGRRELEDGLDQYSVNIVMNGLSLTSLHCKH